MSYPLCLTGRHVVLREFTEDDLDDAQHVVGDERVTRWLAFGTRTRGQTRQMLLDVIERARQVPRTEFYLAATPQDGDRVIGFVRIGLSGSSAGRLGYAMAAGEWGRGYASDAVRTLLDFAFGELKLHRISAAVGPDNAAGIAVIEQLGFTREGLLRDHVHTNGAWRDSVLYSVLAPEWTDA